MYLQSYISLNHNNFIALCKKYRVVSLYGFGSSVNSIKSEDVNDVDLAYKLEIKDPIKRGTALLNFWDDLENFFAMRVDLIDLDQIRNPILREEINKTKVLLYEQQASQISA